MSAVLEIVVKAATGQAEAALGNVSKKAGGLGTAMERAKPAAMGALGAVTGLATGAAKAASELQQSTGAVESVFGAHAAGVQAMAADAADNVGLATSQYENMASVIGSQLKNMGVPMEALAGQTDQLISTGADLAATYGGTTSEAVEALSSLLRGETDPIERYGVSIKQADIAAQKAAMGLSGLKGAADKQATTQATLALLTQQTSAAQGAFARESDTAAGSLQIAQANASNAAAALGTVLLPALAATATKLAEVAGFVERHSTLFQVLAGVVAVVAAAVLGYNAVMAVVPAATAAATAAQWLWNASLLANPLTWVVAGIVALIAIIVVLVKNWDTVKAAGSAAWQAMKSAGSAAVAALKSAGSGLASAWRTTWSAISSAGRAAWAAAKSAGAAAGAALRAVGSALAGAWRATWSAIGSAGRAAWAAAKSAGAAAGNALRAVGSSIRSSLVAAFNAAKSAGRSFLAPAVSAVNSLLGLVARARDAVSNLLAKARDLPGASMFGGFSFFNAADPAPRFRYSPSNLTAAAGGGLASWAAAARSSWTSSGNTIQAGDTINITVNGALDPVAVAAQIRSILNGDARRSGAVATNARVV